MLILSFSEKLRGTQQLSRGCGRPTPPVTPPPNRHESTTYDDGSENGGWFDPLAPENISSTTKRTTTSRRTTTRRTTTRRTTTQRTTTRRTTTAGSGRDCDEGRYYPNPRDCQKYYLCAGAQLVLQACGAGLYWDSRARMCNWEDSVLCDLNSSPPPSTHTFPQANNVNFNISHRDFVKVDKVI